MEPNTSLTVSLPLKSKVIKPSLTGREPQPLIKYLPSLFLHLRQRTFFEAEMAVNRGLDTCGLRILFVELRVQDYGGKNQRLGLEFRVQRSWCCIAAVGSRV